MLVFELDPEHGVRQRLDDRPFDLDCISLSHRRPLDPDYVLMDGPDAESDTVGRAPASAGIAPAREK
jgi:hypothetical protein